MTQIQGSIVARIPVGRTIDDALAVMKAMSRCYPTHTMSLANDYGGGMLIVYNPDAPPPPPGQKPARASIRQSKTGNGSVEIALGKDEVGDLFAFVFSPKTKQEDAVAAMAGWMAAVLESMEGATNFVTFTFDIKGGGKRYAMTIQDCDGLTPAEKLAQAATRIAELETQFATQEG